MYVHTTHTPGPLLKAVTSAKLSPRGQYALVGYGVRNQGVVEDHPYRYSTVQYSTDRCLFLSSFIGEFVIFIFKCRVDNMIQSPLQSSS